MDTLALLVPAVTLTTSPEHQPIAKTTGQQTATIRESIIAAPLCPT
jgi:hypothetical protein